MTAERVNLEHARSRVQVVPYSPKWPLLFERERQVLAGALREAAAQIHHIGSTSVPDLCSKDTLDILVVTTDVTLVLQREQALDDAGYHLRDTARPHRCFFRRLEDGRRRVHLHAVERGHPEVDEYLLFRDFLRADSAERREYGDYKVLLARTSRDREEYVTTKQQHVTTLLDRARAWRASKDAQLPREDVGSG